MILQELKLYLCEKYKLIGFLIIGLLILLSSFFYFKNYSENHEESKVDIGVISENDKELNFFFSLFESTNVGEKFNFFSTDEIEANAMLENDEITAYVIVPEEFLNSINTGENLPVTIVGNEDNWVETKLVKLAINVAISYLTTAQAGIYATLDVARDLGISNSVIDDKILVPINLSYGMALMNFNSNFDENLTSAIGGNSLKDYYSFSAVIFLLMISISMFIINIQEGITKTMLNKYRLSGVSFKRVLFNKSIALFLVLTFCTLPVFWIFKLKTILILSLVVSIAILIANLTNSSTGIISVLFIAFFTLFISGGIIPIVFLPDLFKVLARLTPNYWVININNGTLPIIAILVYIVILNIISYYVMNRRSGL